MKNLLIFLLISTNSFAQNKKEQIEALNHSVDSLNTVLATTRDNSAKDIRELNDKIKKVDVPDLSDSIDEISFVVVLPLTSGEVEGACLVGGSGGGSTHCSRRYYSAAH